MNLLEALKTRKKGQGIRVVTDSGTRAFTAEYLDNEVYRKELNHGCVTVEYKFLISENWEVFGEAEEDEITNARDYVQAANKKSKSPFWESNDIYQAFKAGEKSMWLKLKKEFHSKRWCHYPFERFIDESLAKHKPE